MIIISFRFMKPLGFGGIWPLCFIKPKYKNNKAIIEHERVHNEQCLEGWFLGFWFKYLFNKQARYQYELEGYAVQHKYGWGLNATAYDLWYYHGKRINKTLAEVKQDVIDKVN